MVFSIELLDKPVLTAEDFINKVEDSFGMDTNNGHLDFSDNIKLKNNEILSKDFSILFVIFLYFGDIKVLAREFVLIAKWRF